MTNSDSKSYYLGFMLFHSSLPKQLKEAWYRLLPMMDQEQLKTLYNLLKNEEKVFKKMRLNQVNEWKRMKLEHETQIRVFLDDLK